ncbi:MAG: alanine--tRNA ligase [Actinomycetota bacterium]|nr:alanine--tRNA ligase [Actinomycetota bacterium]
MESAEIRRRFLDHFVSRDHAEVPSAPLPSDDPQLLFTVAGMVPFMPYFLGQQQAPWPRAVSVQKCVRTLDIEEVGKTTRHGTFFQMDGNFSFGDYFKDKAIEYAWELSTGSQADGGFGFPERDLLVTVYHDDEESVGLWKRIAGLPDDRIVRLGKKDNYWHMGVPGPGGPCSEILLDRGSAHGPEGDVEKAGDRYLEFWNLVFMQEALSAVRSKEDFDVAGPLPAQSIDTGMGQERVAYLLQGVDNMYEIDEIRPVLDRAAEVAQVRYGADHEADVRLRVVADHVRSALMVVNDGVTPANEGRGYVLRRLIRRAVRSMRLLGVEDPTMGELLVVAKDRMARSYPELETAYPRIEQVVTGEEDAFRRTLVAGTTILDTAVRTTKAQGETTLSGERAFALHDTYGFPIDLTLEMAAEQGVAVDEVGFRQLMTEQRDRAKADSRSKKTGHVDLSVYRGVLDSAGPSEFTGYREVITDAVVRGLVVDDQQVTEAGEGTEVELVLDRTPFYAEAGGQLADRGIVRVGDAEVEVRDVQTPIRSLVVHRARVLTGSVAVGSAAVGEVDVERRRAISRAHTATHMVHKVFRDVLGETATQAGSENAPGRFRFDFTHTQAVPASVLRDVEQTVNAVLVDDLEVHASVMTQAEARALGAMALFGEKYGDEVRVISVGDWARELCGGTHAQRSGQLGVVKLLGEASIGAGIRRVEALVGTDAYEFLARESVLVHQVSELLKTRPDDLPDRVAGIVERLRVAERDIESMRSDTVLAQAEALAAAPTDVYGVAFVGHRAPDGTSPDDLRRLALDVRAKITGDRPVVVTAVTVTRDRPVVVAAVNETARSWGLRAGDLVRVAAAALGGGGGGKDDVAQGGGKDPSKVVEALAAVEHLVGQRVTGGS